MKMDVTDLKFDDGCFDAILCVGVLHYVENDRKAMQELYRVLKPEGYVIVASGIDERQERTIEYGGPDPTQCYAVRTYGRDIAGKLERATDFEVMTMGEYVRHRIEPEPVPSRDFLPQISNPLRQYHGMLYRLHRAAEYKPLYRYAVWAHYLVLAILLFALCYGLWRL